MKEEWKPVAGWEMYEISTLGRLRREYRTAPLRIFSAGKSSAGYLTYSLWKGNKGKSFNAHRLVAEAFIPVPDGLAGLKLNVNHKDFDRANNDVANLEWVTPSGNNLHSMRAGRNTGSKGKRIRRPVPAYVGELRRLHAAGVPAKRCCELLGLKQSTVSKILNNRRWIV